MMNLTLPPPTFKCSIGDGTMTDEESERVRTYPISPRLSTIIAVDYVHTENRESLMDYQGLSHTV